MKALYSLPRKSLGQARCSSAHGPEKHRAALCPWCSKLERCCTRAWRSRGQGFSSSTPAASSTMGVCALARTAVTRSTCRPAAPRVVTTALRQNWCRSGAHAHATRAGAQRCAPGHAGGCAPTWRASFSCLQQLLPTHQLGGWPAVSARTQLPAALPLGMYKGAARWGQRDGTEAGSARPVVLRASAAAPAHSSGCAAVCAAAAASVPPPTSALAPRARARHGRPAAGMLAVPAQEEQARMRRAFRRPPPPLPAHGPCAQRTHLQVM